MKISSQLKGGIYEVSFRYNTNLGGYATLMSDIPKIYTIVSKRYIRRRSIPNGKEYVNLKRMDM